MITGNTVTFYWINPANKGQHTGRMRQQFANDTSAQVCSIMPQSGLQISTTIEVGGSQRDDRSMWTVIIVCRDSANRLFFLPSFGRIMICAVPPSGAANIKAQSRRFTLLIKQNTTPAATAEHYLEICTPKHVHPHALTVYKSGSFWVDSSFASIHRQLPSTITVDRNDVLRLISRLHTDHETNSIPGNIFITLFELTKNYTWYSIKNIIIII